MSKIGIFTSEKSGADPGFLERGFICIKCGGSLLLNFLKQRGG